MSERLGQLLMAGDGEAEKAEQRRSKGDSAHRRMQTGLITELQQMEQDIMQRLSSVPANSPIKLAILSRVADCKSRIIGVLGAINHCLDLPPPHLEDKKPSLPATTKPTITKRKVAFIC
ncbi:hypothetical protein KP509_39G056200 [Ceratopteris richardii]|uniref:Uncharacterized protein n=1 Tax=Ceratopteris richardii TaxID=49495 RepID=A0A8T2Q258_CERRI|nr:hypothetical protein KP509_39G056200 [Ceratopteris richardii]